MKPRHIVRVLLAFAVLAVCYWLIGKVTMRDVMEILNDKQGAAWLYGGY